jgi:metal-sulfur cluster biosynthetic enzyme
MTKSVSEQEVRQALSGIKHPEINNTLAELGMLKDVALDSNRAIIKLALPFMGIPVQVKEHIVNSLRQTLAGLEAGLEVEINLVEMTPEERARFIKMAQEGWIG